VEILIFRKNRVLTVQGPFADLEDLDEKQQRKQLVMRLRVLDLRENKLTNVLLKDAATFLKETVVLMWDNPFASTPEEVRHIAREFNDPGHLFRAATDFDDEDFRLM
jgi:hypothetical protein